MPFKTTIFYKSSIVSIKYIIKAYNIVKAFNPSKKANTLFNITSIANYKNSPVPIFFTFIWALLIISIPILTLFKIDKARHLILYGISSSEFDPGITTILICLLSYLLLLIYKKHRNQLGYHQDDIVKLLKLFNLLVILIPICLWTMILFANTGDYAYSSKIISFSGIFFIILEFIKGGAIVGTQNIDLKGSFRESYFFFIFLILIYHYYSYDYISSKSLFNGIKDSFSFYDDKKKIYPSIIFSSLLVICISSFYRGKIFNKKLNFVIKLILFLSGLYSFFFVWYLGSLPALDIIIIYCLTCRLLIYAIPIVFFQGYFKALFVINYFLRKIKYKPINGLNIITQNKINIQKILRIGVLILPAFLLYKFITNTILREKDRSLYEIPLMDSNKEHQTLLTYTKNWLKTKADNDTLYIVAGQGGGSRAGATFFTTMSHLDQIIGDKTFAMSTVSGSSNGAAFYLSLKSMNPKVNGQPSKSILDRTTTLYNEDYLSKSLYKLLFPESLYKIILPFIDYTSDPKRYLNRNISLKEKEREVLTKLSEDTTFYISEFETLLKPNLPLFFPNTYIVNHSLKGIFSSVKYTNRFARDTYSVLDTLHKYHNKTMDIGNAVSTSQMFPIISASGNLYKSLNVDGHTRKDSLQFFDGGVYDNYGYETAADLYKFLRHTIDSLGRNNKIMVLSIENAPFVSQTKISTSELESVMDAGLHSVFNSKVNESFQYLSESIQKSKGDGFYKFPIYYKKTNSVETDSLFQKASKDIDNSFIMKFFRVFPDSNKVIMSRFLTKSEIEFINYWSHFEVNKFKGAKSIKEPKNENVFTIYFDLNRADLDLEDSSVSYIINTLVKNHFNYSKIKISGYTDSKGGLGVNKWIRHKREFGVYYALQKRGVPRAKLSMNLIDSTFQGTATKYHPRSFDRRVMITLVK